MQRVYEKRIGWGQVKAGAADGMAGLASTPPCENIGMVALARFLNPNTKAWSDWERFLVVDCSQDVDRPRHIAEGLVLEVDAETAQRHGFFWDGSKGEGKTQVEVRLEGTAVAEPQLTDQQMIMAAGKAINKPGVALNGGVANWITIHETDNEDPGADALMHVRFVHNGGGDRHVSFHATVDDKGSIQILSWFEASYNAGDGGGDGNYDAIAIEVCVNRGANWAATIANLVKLVRKLMAQFNIPITQVVQHNRWSGKNCPRKLRANGGRGWAEFMAALGAQSTADNRFDPVTGFYISHGFKAEYERLERLGVAMQMLGRPISGEYEMQLGTWRGNVQDFERGRMEWHTESGTGVVMYGLINNERIEALQKIAEAKEAEAA